MSAAAPAAARLHDPVAHSHALGGFLAGAAIGLAAAVGTAVVIGAVVGAAAAEVASAGLATPLVVGAVATVGEFGLNAVVGGKLMGVAEDAGEALGGSSLGATSGAVSAGSPNVRVNGLAAARALDPDTCDASKLAQGSRLVAINGLPASRVGDKTTCGAVVSQGSPNVVIGGPAATLAPIQSEVPAWARWAVVVAGLLPALGGLARTIGPALAEVEASGFARAAQTGVKALGRALEEKAGATRPSAPFDGEPMIPPGAKVTTSDFKAERPTGPVDMTNLSPSDDAAASQLQASGWNQATQEQVLNSGDAFTVQPGSAGDNLYGFSSSDPAYAKGANSAYWMDEPTYNNMQSQYQNPATGEWDSAGVKNSLALACYNQADTVYQGQLASDQPLTASTIGPAQETVTYANPDGSTNVFTRTMSGGGSQVAPTIGGVTNITRLGP